MRTHLLTLAFALLTGIVATAPFRAAHAVGPHNSWHRLTTGNGYGFATYDAESRRLTFLSDHPYVERAPGDLTRDLAYDAYFGLRASGGAAWLSERPVEALEYRDQTHVVHATQSLGPLRGETYVLAPWGLEAPAVVLVLRVTNTARVPVTDAAAYALLNFHLGSGAPEPGTNDEHITWDAATNSYRETGPSGLSLVYVPFGEGTLRHGASPNNPYFTGRDGGDLVQVDDSGTINDAVAGFQWTFDTLAPGAERWVGVVITLASAAQARTYIANRDPRTLVEAEITGWNAWRVQPPANLSPAELRVWRQSETVLRMAQSREAPPSRGQLLASLPPGIWWITWVRDMSYAIAALARSGHAAEAGLGVDFWRDARVGDYRQYVGHDYYVSVVRYYGNGQEWSDSDHNGPNIEFDGFGLAAWAGRLANRREMDVNAETLRALVDNTGLIARDSSIWERHWNGNEKHFTYTSITAAQGLCATGDAMTARSIRDAMVRLLILPPPGGGLAGNLEELRAGAPARDAAVVEAINWGLIDPQGRLARETIAQFERLRTPVNRGYFRNDDGDGYDSQEWVFIDLRIASALRRMGRTDEAEELLAWVTAQADANYGLHAELYHRDNADYVGAVPMVGFGAGAYMLALMDRAAPETLSTECFPPEQDPRNLPSDGGSGSTAGSGRGGCSTAFVQRDPGGQGWISLAGLTLATALVTRRRRFKRTGMLRACRFATLALVAWLFAACGPANPMPDGGDGSTTDAPTRDAPPSVRGAPVRECTTRFVFPLGRQANSVAVAGEWNAFSTSANPMSDGTFTNVYRAAIELPPGDYGYKFVADGDWRLDPGNALTRYVGGVENSRLIVPDCNVPLLRVERAEATSDGSIEIDVQYLDGARRAGLDPGSVRVTMNRQPVAADVVRVDLVSGRIAIRVRGLENNKYTFRVNARDHAARAARELIVPMWVEDQPFDWRDGVMYFAFTDRFRNGDPSNDAPLDGIDARANYQGGDLRGVLAALREGYFEALGVRTIWLSPVNANTNSPGRGNDGRMYSGYHGYWPSEPRAVEERFGTMEDLRALTAEAHRRGIRVIFDLVQNQLHRDHPYYRDHARDGWFNGDGSCVCGGPGCDWDSHALDCWFTSYLPDVNWTSMPTVDQMIDDALFWLTEADADGFRVDAVKHMQHIASTTLRARIRENLETGNARYYLVGETFTGGDQGGRDLIQSYVSERELWGQFDFPIFWATVRAFAQNEGTMGDLDGAVRAGEATYQNAIMSPFLGNHDVERFISRAAGDLMGNTMDQAWNNPPPQPDRDEPYDRLFLALTFILTQPGVPLIYYGDEIGMPGAADPDNRRLMRFGPDLSPREQRLLERVRVIAHARGTHPGLRRGARRTLHTDGDGYVYARGAGPDLAIVAINRGATTRSVRVNVPPELGAEGQTLRDLLGGPSVTISGGAFDVPFTPRGAALYVR